MSFTVLLRLLKIPIKKSRTVYKLSIFQLRKTAFFIDVAFLLVHCLLYDVVLFIFDCLRLSKYTAQGYLNTNQTETQYIYPRK